tara:strand:+ start:162 stop:860 length:699 start_codon:yes stop_codon:yes gene_type:complete
MAQKEKNDQDENNKFDSSSDPSCPICEGQGCECAQSDDNQNIVDKEDDQDLQVNNNTEENKFEEEIETLKEEKIRLLAEMENLRKRFEREKVETIKFGSINLARDILSPADNLERALSALPENEDYSQNIKNLVEGLKMVLKEFKSILEKHGVKKIEAMDKKFDHNFHQAMMEIERDDVDDGTVVQEVQSGYTMHDRLLRAAMVGVSKKPNNNVNGDENKNTDEDKAEKSEK